MSVDELRLIPMTYGDYLHNIKIYLELIKKANPTQAVKEHILEEVQKILFS